MTTTYYASYDSRPSAAALTRGAKDLFAQVQTVARAVGEIATIASAAQGAALRRTMRASGLEGLPMPSLARARGCRLPACDCKSSDLGEIRKVIDSARDVRIVFKLRNTTSQRRIFALNPKPMTGDDGSNGGRILLVPDRVDLEPGETKVIEAVIDASDHQSGVEYGAAVTIASETCDAMRLRLTVLVEREIDHAPTLDLHCCCHPRPRPLHWYHHYYCDPRETKGARELRADTADVEAGGEQVFKTDQDETG
ncbi:hypothetical protein [Sphingomonas hengshuiensis]|uniref:Uncharacterized protein n=1 Tax=Sphingomonas hengshuiensis TaxID=1609977 RepID=A0A7U4J6J5_9SPHN|nr:hypothetical protein [Sphingomonas hengshuiensis]AJP71193.1 hypothetical protein TS85_04250 [Sphingomonas hengshuiensis]